MSSYRFLNVTPDKERGGYIASLNTYHQRTGEVTVHEQRCFASRKDAVEWYKLRLKQRPWSGGNEKNGASEDT